MRATDSMICWTPVDACDNPTRGRMALVPWPDTAGRSDEFAFTALACDAAVHSMRPIERRHFVMSNALAAIIADGLDPAEVHRALWPLDEYRDALPTDTPPPDAKTRRSR